MVLNYIGNKGHENYRSSGVKNKQPIANDNSDVESVNNSLIFGKSMISPRRKDKSNDK